MKGTYDDHVNNKQTFASSSNIDDNIKVNDVNHNYSHNIHKPMGSIVKGKARRPAKPLYVPRALRTQEVSSINCIKSSFQNDTKSNDLKEANILHPITKETKSTKNADDVKKEHLNMNFQCTNTTCEQDFSSLQSVSTKSDCQILEDLTFKNLECERENTDFFVKLTNVQLSKDLYHDKALEISSPENLKFTNILQMSQVHKNEACGNKEAISIKKPTLSTKTLDYLNQNELPLPGTVAECSSDFIKTKVPKSTAIMNDTWCTVYNDDCLKPHVIKQLQAVIGDAQIIHPKSNYKEFKCEDVTTAADDYSSVIELYDFPVEFKTHDLLSALSGFKSENFVIKWVDDNHAISIFSSSFIAHQVLELKHPFIKVRPVSQGLPESKLKARRLMKERYFRTPRPATSAILAKRLVSGALGVKANISREEREREKQLMIEARGQKQKAKQHKEDIWNGEVS